MILKRDNETAEILLENLPVLRHLKESDPQRHFKLSRLLADDEVNEKKVKEIFGGNSNLDQRKLLAEEIAAELDTVEPARLMTLIGQALKWQKHVGLLAKGVRFDILKNAAAEKQDLVDEVVSRNEKTIKFGKTTEADCVKFSNDGQYLVSGSSDGFIEIWDYETGQLRKDLVYQANDALMMHSDAVLCLDFSRDGEFLASGSQSGELKVWKIASGKCVKKIKNCHPSGIGHVNFSSIGLEILTCGAGTTEDTFKLQGLVSGRTLREFRGHKAQVTVAKYFKDDKYVISGSSEGEVCVWDSVTSECLTRFSSATSVASSPNLFSVIDLIFPIRRSSSVDSVIIASQNMLLREYTLNGKLVHSADIIEQIQTSESPTRNSKKSFEMSGAALSSHGRIVYCCSDTGFLYVVDLDSWRVLKAVQVHNSNTKGVSHHPHLNVLATFSSDHSLKIWTS